MFHPAPQKNIKTLSSELIVCANYKCYIFTIRVDIAPYSAKLSRDYEQEEL